MNQRVAYRGGASRQRRTRWTVKLMDRLSRTVITACGLGTIVAVGGVCLFLVWMAVPLFFPASADAAASIPAPAPEVPVALDVDEDQLVGWALFPSGKLHVFRVDSGEVLERRDLFSGQAPTAWSLAVPDVERSTRRAIPGKSERWVYGLDASSRSLGYAYGQGRFGSIRLSFRNVYYRADAPPVGVSLSGAGERARDGRGVVVLTRDGQYRKVTVEVEPNGFDPAATKALAEGRIERIDQVYSKSTRERRVVGLTTAGQLRLFIGEEVEAIGTGELRTRTKSVRDLPYAPPPGRGLPDRLVLLGSGDQLLLLWDRGGLMQRLDLRRPEAAHLAETRSLLNSPDDSISAATCLIGKETLVVGASGGEVEAWFLAETADGWKMVPGHRFAGRGAAVTALGPASRNRVLAAGHADGQVRLLAVTTDQALIDVEAEGAAPVMAVHLAPKNDAVFALSGGRLHRWRVDPGYPEATGKALLGRVWYEGRPGPDHVWQTSGGNDAVEPKLSLVPLIFGTLKASFYSLLFGVPLALLAAIYTSEFLGPRLKAAVKPTVELMASLPSVVLGFLAGLVFAQFVESVLPAVLAAFATVPFAFILAAYLWQILPEKLSLRLQRYRFGAICVVLPLGLLAGWGLGPLFELALFGGDLKGWLNGGSGSSVGGWMLLLTPLAALAVTALFGNVVNPWLRRRTRHWSRRPAALIDLAKLGCGVVLTIGLALIVAFLLDAVRLSFDGPSALDPRQTFLGQYSQRNALVVGFVMGFAIIPLIYTIAEDALSAVPAHLRSASLAAGATPWQTASRIVIPTAMSGLFSAVMIGLGRAIGETMIVVMAAGGTPILRANLFEGYLTLSAAIATELPEAPLGGTHYRTLFLAALALFLMTFALNTVAEIVRLRFRRRAYQL